MAQNGQRPPQKALEIIVSYMNKVTHPLYLGYLALEVGYSLARTEEMLQHLEEQGIVHRLKHYELKAFGFRPDANVFGLGPGVDE